MGRLVKVILFHMIWLHFTKLRLKCQFYRVVKQRFGNIFRPNIKLFDFYLHNAQSSTVTPGWLYFSQGRNQRVGQGARQSLK